MDRLEKIIKLIKEENLDRLNDFRENTMAINLVDILAEEINNFNYAKNLEYLNILIKILPRYIKNNKKEVTEKLNTIHQKIKTYLVEKPGNIEKTNKNYKTLKNIINNIELIEISILYDYIDKYDEYEYRLIDYLIFDVKNISLIKDAVQRFPYIVNSFDLNDKSIIVSIMEKYIDEVVAYTKENGINNIIYYDEIIDTFLKSSKLIFDIIDKKTILKIIKQKFKNIEIEKQKKTFYLNNLMEKINDDENIPTESYLEYKYNIKTEFNEAVKSEVRKIVNNYSTSKDRKIIDDYILTFDLENAKEIDDALSIKILKNGNYLLGVHIADPISLIEKNSIIFDEASKRTTSIYLSDKTYSMIPEELSSDLVSLKQGNYRNARTYYFEIDKLGNVIDSKFYKSLINVNKNMTYNEFNEILKYKTTNKKLNDTIINLSKISILLQKYYHADELYTKINRSKNNITNTNIIGLSNGEKVVESSMVFTNYMVAKYFKDNNLPFIFRNHEINNEMMIELDKLKQNFNEKKEYYNYIEMIKQIYPKAIYDVELKGHFGLGIDCYCHVTSPLRRFSDVIASICLDELYFNKYDEEKIEKTKRLINKYTCKINNKRNAIEKFEIEYEKNKN